MIGYLPVNNSIDVFVKGFTAASSVTVSNPFGDLILDAIFTFTIYDSLGDALTGATNVPMPLIDDATAHYRGSTDDISLVIGNWYKVVITCANYEFESVSQFVAQNRPMTANPQYT